MFIWASSRTDSRLNTKIGLIYQVKYFFRLENRNVESLFLKSLYLKHWQSAFSSKTRQIKLYQTPLYPKNEISNHHEEEAKYHDCAIIFSWWIVGKGTAGIAGELAFSHVIINQTFMLDDIRQDNNNSLEREREKAALLWHQDYDSHFHHLTLRIAKLRLWGSERREKKIIRFVICLEAYGS